MKSFRLDIVQTPSFLGVECERLYDLVLVGVLFFFIRSAFSHFFDSFVYFALRGYILVVRPMKEALVASAAAKLMVVTHFVVLPH